MSAPGRLEGILCLLPMLFAGCATYRISVPAYTLHPAGSPPHHFIAGAGSREITPPPGFPMGGHGLAGRVARGYWTRLYARSFYFDSVRDHRLALVSAELFAIPAGLHAKVLQAVNRTHRMSPRNLCLPPHTHHGPSNFASAEVYNSFAGPLPDFDPILLDFLAAQISGASSTPSPTPNRSPSCPRYRHPRAPLACIKTLASPRARC